MLRLACNSKEKDNKPLAIVVKLFGVRKQQQFFLFLSLSLASFLVRSRSFFLFLISLYRCICPSTHNDVSSLFIEIEYKYPIGFFFLLVSY